MNKEIANLIVDALQVEGIIEADKQLHILNYLDSRLPLLLKQCSVSSALRQKLQQSIDVLTAEGLKYERMKTKDVIDLLKYLQELAQ